MRQHCFRISTRVLALTLTASISLADYDEDCGVHFEQGQTLTNWSSTHTISPARVYEPTSAQECVRVLQLHHEKKLKVRPVGTALSPNGIGLASSSDGNMLSLSALDYVEVDVERKQVTVGAGARVSVVLSELKKFGLTLENFSSIQEQQVGGWTQVSAHGTGITLPPVDEMVVRLQLATPTEGLMTLSRDQQRDSLGLFHVAKVGLGCLGVVTELTLKCIPQLNLRETTFVSDRASIQKGHAQRLSHFRHVRYMWLPYTNTVVAVVSNPTTEAAAPFVPDVGVTGAAASVAAATLPMRRLLESVNKGRQRETSEDTAAAVLETLSFAQLRDRLLAAAPLDTAHIKAVNAAEAEYWAASCGTRIDDSTNILGFDCGGEQLVLEVCFPTKGLDSGRDLDFVRQLLEAAEQAGLPAPSPIEQRWTCASSSPLSPAYSTSASDVFSWVGVIMYLPPGQSEDGRAAIAGRFREYCRLLDPLCRAYGAKAHWAKLEARHDDPQALRAQRRDLQEAYGSGLQHFNQLRLALDPHRVLGNKLVDSLLEDPDSPTKAISWKDFKR